MSRRCHLIVLQDAIELQHEVWWRSGQESYKALLNINGEDPALASSVLGNYYQVR